MLERLLRTVAQSGMYSFPDLARRLDVSEGLLEQMLQDLVRMRYLAPLVGGCAGQGVGCSLAKTCTVGRPGSVWALTEKGLKTAEGR